MDLSTSPPAAATAKSPPLSREIRRFLLVHPIRALYVRLTATATTYHAMPIESLPMRTSLRQEHREATRRRIITAAHQVFVDKGYQRATIEGVLKVAGVSRATLYQHFDSKGALMSAASENLVQEARERLAALIPVLLKQDFEALRLWIGKKLEWYNANRSMALAVREAQLEEVNQAEVKSVYLDYMEPWVRSWPEGRQEEARLRFELCRLQMSSYMWGALPPRFGTDSHVVEILAQSWWNMLVEPMRENRT